MAKKELLPFRDYHLVRLLEQYSAQDLPLDLFISHYFKDNSALGSKDRGYIAEGVYAFIRWKALIDYFNRAASWAEKWSFFQKIDWDAIQDDPSIPPHIRISFPKGLYALFADAYGEKQALKLCAACNTPAPTTVRANAAKISREELLSIWSGQYDVVPCKQAPCGIQFLKRMNFFTLPEFKQGYFEVQDEASQLISMLVDVKEGDLVLDYCAGSGGKTLAFAPYLHNSGQIYLHDIRKGILLEAKRRLKRAGIQNAQVIQPDSAHLKKLKKKMDWVLVDAPCSGTGTLRRNPDMKWKFNQEMLDNLISQQRVIFERALSYLHPEGRIVYATCSILPDENERQVEHFIKTYRLQVEGEPFQSIPSIGSMDGFFGIVLKT